MSDEQQTREDLLAELATKYQQENYELLPDIVLYEKENYQYLEQYIGLILFNNEKLSDNPSCDNKNSASQGENDISDEITYNDQQREIIKQLFNKICEYSIVNNSGTVSVGLIWNIIFFKKKKKEEEENVNIEPESELHNVPVFTIQRHEVLVSNEKITETHITCYKLWYMDSAARIYKSWSDYMENNTLPQCTMVVPHSGFYQANTIYAITESYSKVWVDIVPSPSSKTLHKALKCGDVISNVVGIAAPLTIGAISMFTPIGPIAAAAGLISTGLSSSWTIGRCSRDLRDRSRHDQSISIANKEALRPWLGIAGSSLGFALNGGTLALARRAQKGLAISTAAKCGFNTLVVGDITVNAIGFGYNSYSLYEKYNNKTIQNADILLYMCEVLLYGSTVVNVTLARKVIEMSQGKVLDQMKQNIRSKKFRKQYNRMLKKQDGYTTHDAATIIRKFHKINRTSDFMRWHGLPKPGLSMAPENKYLLVNNKKLLDPTLCTDNLIKNKTRAILHNFATGLTTSTKELYKVLEREITRFCESDTCRLIKKLPVISDFVSIIDEIRYATTPETVLMQLLRIVTVIIKVYKNPEVVFVDVVMFIWGYVKENLREYAKQTVDVSVDDDCMCRKLTEIIDTVFTEIDKISGKLVCGLIKYLATARKFNLQTTNL